MRWPLRRTPPGMVRVSDKRLIDLLRRALRAHELEDEQRALDAQIAEHQREVAARTVIAERGTAVDVTFTEVEVRGLLADLPLTAAGGELHRAAFEALLDQQIWDRRLTAAVEPEPTPASHQEDDAR